MELLKNQIYKKLSGCIKCLASDAIEKVKSGHPGMVLGMSDVMTILVLDFLKFHPKYPKWFNRDRLVLSAGHGSLLLYTFYYLTGYVDFTLEDLKNFRQIDSKTPGHPEYGSYPAVETTTGPLGQGFANAVGMAIAQKKYEQKLGNNICDYKIYCIVGDGCLMEGVSYEAASLAGHLKLNNLIVLFDSNNISIDGPTSLATSEDQVAKFKAQGWETYSIDGHNYQQINEALQKAQDSTKPCFIVCDTVIAKGCRIKEGSESAHGSPLGREAVLDLKKNLDFNQEEFAIPEELKKIWEESWLRNKDFYNNWQVKYENLNTDLKQYIEYPKINPDLLDNLQLIKEPNATRASSGKVMEQLASFSDKIIFGSADLSLSINIKNKNCKAITKNDFSGNFIHYGIREHAMAAIINGLAVSGFLPIGGTFLVFSDYMKPALRLSSIMNLQVIYIMTHDSIGLGEDGSTHQPVEHLAAYRANPNLFVFRPADFVETIECWKLALSNKKTPSMLVLARQAVMQVRDKIERENLSEKGAYILCASKSKFFDVTIFATGSELSIAKEVYESLTRCNINVRLISVPCVELFFKQTKEYINTLLSNSRLKVAIEAGSHFGWHRLIGSDGIFFGVETFGASAPAADLYKHFGLTPNDITKQIKNALQNF